MKGHCLVKRARAIKGPRHPPEKKKKKKKILGPTLCLDVFYTFFLSLKHKKHIKASGFFLLHQKYKVLFLYPIFFSLVLHLGFGV